MTASTHIACCCAENLEQLEALVQVATSILSSLREAGKEGSTSAPVLQHVNDYLFKHGLHDINMFRLVRYSMRPTPCAWKIRPTLQAGKLDQISATHCNELSCWSNCAGLPSRANLSLSMVFPDNSSLIAVLEPQVTLPALAFQFSP
jgi:hypothetical protein